MEGHKPRPKVDTGGGTSKVVALVAIATLLIAVGGALYFSQSPSSTGTPAPAAQHSP